MKKIYIIVWMSALAAMACGLLLCESHYLWKVQELNLFLQTTLFFKEMMVLPAGLLSYVGSWFTQFLYYPWIGVMLLCAWWLLLMAMMARTFCVPDRWAPLLLIPVALLLLTNVDLGYWLFMLKLRGHFFLTTIATVAVVALLWAFRSLPERYGLRAAWLLVTGVAGYPLLGIYGLAATLLMGLWAWRLMPRGRAVLYSIAALLLVVAVPLLCYRYVYHETNLANVYFAGLPLFFVTEEHAQYYLPYWLLALFMVGITLISPEGLTTKPSSPGEESLYQKRKGEKEWKKSLQQPKMANPLTTRKEAGDKARTWVRSVVAQALVLGVTAWGVIHFWYKDENFRHEIAMQHLIEQTDWEGVLQEAAEQKSEPTRSIVLMRNLALSRLGRQGDLMYKYRNGAKPYNAPFPMSTLLNVGMLTYYHYGLLNSCNRLSTEMGVEFGWRAEHLKYMVRSDLLNGEKQAAMKYINLLKHTLFFKEWACKAEALLNDRALIGSDREMEPITHMMHYTNSTSGDQAFVERFLMNQLAKSDYSEDPYFQEQALLASLWLKDPLVFWRQFNTYIRLHPKERVPVAYQEAAYLFGKFEGRPNLDKMPFSPEVKDAFEKFFQTFSRFEGMQAEDVRKMEGLPFTDNFYYDYHIMSNLPD